MYYDPTGHFFVSALLIGTLVGGIIGTGVSVISQGITNGWDNINGWQVLLDGTIGAASGLLSATGIGTVGAALISGGLCFVGSVGGDLISSNGDWSSINWANAVIMGIVNVGLGAWAGAGSQNSAALGKGLLRNGNVNKTFGIIYNAANNYLLGNISKRSFSGVFNLYGNQFINAVSKVLPGTIARLTAFNLGKLGITSIISGSASIGLNYLF